MARIKSAWEIALEKTADIKIDENKYRQESLEKEGMALAGKFINNIQMSADELAEGLASFGLQDQELIKSGIKKVVLSNIALPSDEAFELRFSRISLLASALNPGAADFMNQIKEFLKQYLTARQDFVNRMKEQINQMMKDNPQGANSAQYADLISKNLKKMEDQYSQALADSAAQLEEML